MKWNFDEWNRKHGHRSMPSYAFIHCLTELEKRTGKSICEQLVTESGKEEPRGTYEVKFSVNGHELDFTDVFTAFDEQLDRMMAEEAAKLINDKFNGLSDAIDELRREGLDRIRTKVGLPTEEYQRDLEKENKEFYSKISSQAKTISHYEAELDTLKQNFFKYASHTPECPAHKTDIKDCNCGLAPLVH